MFAAQASPLTNRRRLTQAELDMIMDAHER